MSQPIELLSIHELKNKLPALTAEDLILDVRTPDEFAEGHIPGAKNISHEFVGDHSKDLRPYRNLYIYCRSGGRVQVAGQALLNQGFNNIKLIVGGGMPDWAEAGYPVEK